MVNFSLNLINVKVNDGNMLFELPDDDQEVKLQCFVHSLTQANSFKLDFVPCFPFF